MLQLQLFERLTEQTGLYVFPQARERWQREFGSFGFLSKDTKPLCADDIKCEPEVEFAVTYRMLLAPLIERSDASKVIQHSLERRRQGHFLLIASKLRDVSVLLKSQAGSKEASVILENILDIFQRRGLYVPFQIHVIVMFELGRCFRYQHKLNQAMSLLERALRILELHYSIGTKDVYHNEFFVDFTRQNCGHPFLVSVVNEMLLILELKNEKRMWSHSLAEMAAKLFTSMNTFVRIFFSPFYNLYTHTKNKINRSLCGKKCIKAILRLFYVLYTFDFRE